MGNTSGGGEVPFDHIKQQRNLVSETKTDLHTVIQTKYDLHRVT